MAHKCSGCFWKTEWEDNISRFPICERIYWGSFERCKAECEKPGPCPNYFSHEEAERNMYDDEEGEIKNE